MSGKMTYTVRPGNTLGGIAATYLGSVERWSEITLMTAAPGTSPWDERGHAPDGSPLIFPGDVLLVPVSAPMSPQPSPPEDIHGGGEIFRKRQWTGVEHQTPVPKLEIFTPTNDGYDPRNPDFIYTADLRSDAYTKILAFSFTEAVDDLSGSFGFTVEDEKVDGQGRTVFDLIPVRSVVKIYEGDKARPVFVGIIRRRHLGMSMSSQGVKRTVTFNGKSIISAIAEFTVSLDVRIQNVADAMAKTKDLTAELSRENPLSIKRFMAITWEHFKEVSTYTTGISPVGLVEVINRFIGEDPDTFINIQGRDHYLRYNVAMVFYNAANNVIADTWRNILPDRVYEFFSRCENGEPRIITRQVPFGDPNDGGNFLDWTNLPIYHVSPISQTDHSLEQSDEEVYTAFVSYIIGSARDRMFSMGANQTSSDDLVRHDYEKQKLYGFRPLELNFNGYARRGNAGNAEMDSLTEAIRNLNEKAYYWYSRLDEMYSGTMMICNDFNNPETNPRVGCRAKFKGGEFYITRTEHTWIYGKTPKIKLTLSRGMVYDGNGRMRPGADGVLRHVGRRFRELERGE